MSVIGDNRKIFLFTLSYPFGNGETFLNSELKVLSNTDANVVLVPFFKSRIIRRIPNNCKVDVSLADDLEKKSERKIYPLLFNLISIVKGIWVHRPISFSGLRDVVGFAHHGRIIYKWALKKGFDQNVILYTYWLERVTFGLSLYKAKVSNKPALVSRAHRFDLYEELRTHKFIPFREDTIHQLDKLFVISMDGYQYLRDRFGKLENLEVSKLGIYIENKSLPSKESDNLTIVSCSSVIPVKRVEFIFRTINEFCGHQDKRIKWFHFGNGVDFERLRELAKDHDEKLEITLAGNVDNDQVIDFYQANYIDCFINLSDSEGIPVSMMEAIAFGIPILARNVGGIREIVNNTTGILLNEKASLKDTVRGLEKILSGPFARREITIFFNENYSATKNYESFYKSIMKLK